MGKLNFTSRLSIFAFAFVVTGAAAQGADAPAGVVESNSPSAEPASAYITLFGGGALAMTVDGTFVDGGDTISLPTKLGYVAGGAVGTALMPNVRGEVEVSYVHHDLSGTISQFGNNPSVLSADGNFSTLYVLGNLWYDLNVGGGITPYLGGGLGGAVMLPDVTYSGSIFSFSTAAAAFAGQLGAGVKFQLTDNVAIDVGYRAKAVVGGKLASTNFVGDLMDVRYIDQTVQVGATFGF